MENNENIEICESCGVKISKDDKFCQNCGKKLFSVETQEKFGFLSNEKSIPLTGALIWKILLTILGTCIIIFAIFLLYSFINNHGGLTDSPDTIFQEISLQLKSLNEYIEILNILVLFLIGVILVK